MKTLRLIIGSFVVYFAIAILHACSPHMMPSPSSSTGIGGTATHVGGSGGAGGHGGSFVASTSGAMGGKGGSHGGGMGGAGGMMNPVGDADAEESGSRLKAKRIVGDDGSRQFDGWYDTILKVPCAYYRMQDGSLRCVPVDPFLTIGLGGFSDSACTVSLGARVSAACVPAYAVQSLIVAPMCGASIVAPTYIVYPIVGPYVGPLYEKSGTSCSLIGQSPYPGQDTYVIGTAAPSSMFVGGTIVQDP